MNTSSNMHSAREFKEKQTLDLKIVSPAHIGTREGKLTALEYLFVDGRTHIIDEDRFGKFLKSRGCIDQFVQNIGTGRFSMEAFLKKLPRMNFKQALPDISNFSIEGGSPNMNEFRPFIRDGNGDAFIPGTSLKGVLRTALLYGMLKANSALLGPIEDIARKQLGLLKGEGGKRLPKNSYSEKWLQEDLLQKFSLPGSKAGPNEDILRCLTVRDAYPIGNTRTQIVKVQFLSRNLGGAHYWSSKKTGAMGPLELWLEVVPGGIFRTELLWDGMLFDEFRKHCPDRSWPVTCLGDLVGMASDMSRDLFRHEQQFYSPPQPSPKNGGDATKAGKSLQSWYGTQQGRCIRVGFGSGMLSTTVNLLFSEKTRQEIRNVCGHPRADDPAPKSRRVLKVSEDTWNPLGWMQIGPQGTFVPDRDISTAPGTPIVKIGAAATRKRPSVRPVDLGRPGVGLSVSNLTVMVQRLVLSDKIGLERIIDALDGLEEKQAEEIASLLRDKLKALGHWDKHPKRFEIECFISENCR